MDVCTGWGVQRAVQVVVSVWKGRALLNVAVPLKKATSRWGGGCRATGHHGGPRLRGVGGVEEDQGGVVCLATGHHRGHWGDSCRPRTHPVPFAPLSPVVMSRVITRSSTFPRQAAGPVEPEEPGQGAWA